MKIVLNLLTIFTRYSNPMKISWRWDLVSDYPIALKFCTFYDNTTLTLMTYAKCCCDNSVTIWMRAKQNVQRMLATDREMSPGINHIKHAKTSSYIDRYCSYLSSYPGYFRVPHWKSMGLPEISRVTRQLRVFTTGIPMNIPQWLITGVQIINLRSLIFSWGYCCFWYNKKMFVRISKPQTYLAGVSTAKLWRHPPNMNVLLNR